MSDENSSTTLWVTESPMTSMLPTGAASESAPNCAIVSYQDELRPKSLRNCPGTRVTVAAVPVIVTDVA